MKNISLWTTAIVSALFVVMVCIEQHNWKLLSLYGGIIAFWMLIGWFWHHRFDLAHDCKILHKGESPMKCKWIGTLIFFVLIILSVLALCIRALWTLGTQAVNAL